MKNAWCFLWLALALAAVNSRADSLIFVATADNNGVINSSWFSQNNWYTKGPNGDLIHLNKLPVPGDTAILQSSVNAAGNTINIATLFTQGNVVSGGNFIVNVSLQTGDGTSFIGSTVTIQSQWLIDNYCAMSGSTVTVIAGAYVQISPASPPSQLPAGWFLTDSTIHNAGQISITDKTSLTFAGGTNELDNLPNAMITGTGTSRMTTINQADAYLTFNNDGVVECDSGTMRVDGWNVTWTNSMGVGRFKTTATNAVLQMYGPLVVPATNTYIFSGPGISQLGAGGSATVLGTLSVGVIDPATQAIDQGTLQSAMDMSGSGVVHVVALPGFPSDLSLSAGNITVATVNIDPGGRFDLTPSGGVTFSGATVNNGGTTTWTGEGNGFGMYNNATFNNLAGALFDARNDAPILGGGGGNDGTFNNAGTFRKSAGTNDTFFWYSDSPGVTFNNAGLLDVQSGRVILLGGVNSNQFNVAAGARLRFWRSSYTLAPGATFTGPGSVALGGNAATLLVAADTTIGNFTFSTDASSTLDGPATLTLTGASSWSEGTMQGAGAVDIPANSSLTIPTGVPLNQRTINNAGLVTVTNGGISAGQGAVFNNLAGGMLVLATGYSFDYTGAGAVPVFNNAGTLLAPAGSEPIMNWLFTNSGLVEVQGYNISFSRGLTQITGSTVVAAGAQLSPGWTTPLLLLGGTLSGYGELGGPVVNGSVLDFGTAPGVMRFNGGYPKSYTQNSNGVLKIKIGGHSVGTQFDQLAVINNGSAALGGTLEVSFINGFTPALGDQFPVVTFGSGVGAFAAVTGNRAGNGLVLVPRNTGSSVTLVAANDPVPSAPARVGGGFSFDVNTTAGFSYVVQSAESLAPPIQWQTLTNYAGTGAIIPVIVPAGPGGTRFFHVSME